jgi:preprotein translocase subunit SecG
MAMVHCSWFLSSLILNYMAKNYDQPTIKKNKVKTNSEKTRHLENSIYISREDAG